MAKRTGKSIPLNAKELPITFLDCPKVAKNPIIMLFFLVWVAYGKNYPFQHELIMTPTPKARQILLKLASFVKLSVCEVYLPFQDNLSDWAYQAKDCLNTIYHDIVKNDALNFNQAEFINLLVELLPESTAFNFLYDMRIKIYNLKNVKCFLHAIGLYGDFYDVSISIQEKLVSMFNNNIDVYSRHLWYPLGRKKNRNCSIIFKAFTSSNVPDIMRCISSMEILVKSWSTFMQNLFDLRNRNLFDVVDMQSFYIHILDNMYEIRKTKDRSIVRIERDQIDDIFTYFTYDKIARYPDITY